MEPAVNIEEKPAAPVIKEVRADYARGIAIPWRLKMFLKIFLAWLPFSYGFLTKLGMFRHGDLSRSLHNLYQSFDNHFDVYKARFGAIPTSCLELGPGDSIGHALYAKKLGIEQTWLIDVDDFATREEDHYEQICSDLDLNPPSFDREDVLQFANAQYLTQGVTSFEKINNEHVAFSFSHAVLEHVYRDDFPALMNALYRVHKPGSISRHWVDLHDHLGGALNSFRFSPEFWESKYVRQAGFYTNRLTMEEMALYAQEAGFHVIIEEVHRWPALPTSREDMDQSFQDKSDDELNVCTFLMILEKP